MPQKAKILPKSQRNAQNEAVYIENMHGMQTTHVYTYAGDNRWIWCIPTLPRVIGWPKLPTNYN